MEFLILTILVTACVWLYHYYKNKLSFFDKQGIPYKPGWPILGNLMEVTLGLKHFSEIVREVYDYRPDAKYIGMFEFNSRPLIMLRDPELIKTVAIKNFDCFPDHNFTIDVSVDPIFGGNMVNMQGEKWRDTRNLLSPSFTASKMKGMFELMVHCGKIFEAHVTSRAVEDLRMIDTKDLFTRYTNDVIASCAFGINVDSLNNPNNDFYLLGKKAAKFEGWQMMKFFMSKSMPSLMKFFKIKFLDNKTESFFKDIVRETVAMRDKTGVSRPDMIQLMMDARDKSDNHLKLDISEMTAQAFVFFFAGFETTSTQMCIIAHELAINPDVQSRLQDEIDSIMEGSEGNPTYESINEMPYLDAVFRESLRLHSQGMIHDRRCVKPFELPPALPGTRPFIVKPGMVIWIPGTGIHMDSNYYENPEKFDPDRYYQKKVTINDALNLGFGIGPRSCIGNRFAILETKILFFFLLSKFNLKPNSKTCSPFKYSKKVFVIKPVEGYWLDIEPRK